MARSSPSCQPGGLGAAVGCRGDLGLNILVTPRPSPSEKDLEVFGKGPDFKKIAVDSTSRKQCLVMETQAMSENMLSCSSQQPLEVRSCDARSCTPSVFCRCG